MVCIIVFDCPLHSVSLSLHGGGGVNMRGLVRVGEHPRARAYGWVNIPARARVGG